MKLFDFLEQFDNCDNDIIILGSDEKQITRIYIDWNEMRDLSILVFGNLKIKGVLLEEGNIIITVDDTELINL